MSLRWYASQRFVVLKPNSPVIEAARAIEKNNVGAVLVQDEGRVAGIVTNRDLTVRVVARGLDPRATTLAEVMTTAVATLSPADSQSDAIQLMKERNVRRIPLVQGERLVGIVRLDDLLLDEAVPLNEVTTVVQSQIREKGLATPIGELHAGRAEATYQRMLNQLRADAAFGTVEQAESAVEIVLGSLLRRLPRYEARDLIAQLPSLLQRKLWVPPIPDNRINRDTIEAELVQRLDVEPTRAAQLLAATAAVVAESVSAGQMKDVRGHLPEELRGVFQASSSLAAPPRRFGRGRFQAEREKEPR
jgi:CBS domain-containing protein/uncharacterized protein (DUF2267 family)